MFGFRRLSILFLLSYVALFHGLLLLSFAVFGVIFIFVIFPLIFRYYPCLQRHAVFLPWVKWPTFVDFNKPEEQGVEGCINFYLTTKDSIRLGVWHLLPSSLVNDSKNKNLSWFQKSLHESGHNICVYMHGNTASRAKVHRIGLYKVLQSMNFHVICFDYRGYADSTYVTPTKSGVIEDAHTILDYVYSQIGDNKNIKVMVWGHSLGTAVSTACLSSRILQSSSSSTNDKELDRNRSQMPDALILESPFNNIVDEIRHHSLSRLWRKMPFFDWCFTSSLRRGDVDFQTDECIKNIVSMPILVLHAMDDLIVPFKLGRALFSVLWECRSRFESSSDDRSSNVYHHFVPFSEHLSLGHSNIWTLPNLPSYLSEFFENAGM